MEATWLQVCRGPRENTGRCPCCCDLNLDSDHSRIEQGFCNICNIHFWPSQSERVFSKKNNLQNDRQQLHHWNQRNVQPTLKQNLTVLQPGRPAEPRPLEDKSRKVIRQTRCPSQSSQIASPSQLETGQASQTEHLAAPVAISSICKVLILCKDYPSLPEPGGIHGVAGFGSRLVSSPLASGTSWKSTVSGLAAIGAPPIPPSGWW